MVPYGLVDRRPYGLVDRRPYGLVCLRSQGLIGIGLSGLAWAEGVRVDVGSFACVTVVQVA